ncbi:MAG: flagellar basal body P-ring protein FlgI [Acidobacteriota bacterium]
MLLLVGLDSGMAQAQPSQGVRLKDIARFEGVRENQLTGYGLVVGLNGTGDKSASLASTQIANLLDRSGLGVDATQLKPKNAALVLLTATLPPFARPGTRLDVTVSTVLDATSLEGGILIQAPLQGADEQVHAVAQGPLVVGGFTIGNGGDAVQRNVPTVARLPQGALVERSAYEPLQGRTTVRVFLEQQDFGTAALAAGAIRERFGQGAAQAVDPATIEVRIPTRWHHDTAEFLALLGSVRVRPDVPARVVINERTGTIVVGETVRISRVAVAHGNLSVAVATEPLVSQPPAFSDGETVETFDSTLRVEEEVALLSVLPRTTSLGDLVSALNALGASPRDVMSILQSLRAAGALHAELVVM